MSRRVGSAHIDLTVNDLTEGALARARARLERQAQDATVRIPIDVEPDVDADRFQQMLAQALAGLDWDKTLPPVELTKPVRLDVEIDRDLADRMRAAMARMGPELQSILDEQAERERLILRAYLDVLLSHDRERLEQALARMNEDVADQIESTKLRVTQQVLTEIEVDREQARAQAENALIQTRAALIDLAAEQDAIRLDKEMEVAFRLNAEHDLQEQARAEMQRLFAEVNQALDAEADRRSISVAKGIDLDFELDQDRTLARLQTELQRITAGPGANRATLNAYLRVLLDPDSEHRVRQDLDSLSETRRAGFLAQVDTASLALSNTLLANAARPRVAIIKAIADVDLTAFRQIGESSDAFGLLTQLTRWRKAIVDFNQDLSQLGITTALQAAKIAGLGPIVASGLAGGVTTIRNMSGLLLGIPGIVGLVAGSFGVLRAAFSGLRDEQSRAERNAVRQARRAASQATQHWLRGLDEIENGMDRVLVGIRESMFTVAQREWEAFSILLPRTIQPAAEGISRSFGEAMENVMRMVNHHLRSGTFTALFTQMETASGHLGRALRNIVGTFVYLIAESGEFVTTLTAGFENLTARAWNFAREADVQEILQRGVEEFQRFLDVGEALFEIGGTIFSEIQSGIQDVLGPGHEFDSLLGTIYGLLGDLNGFLIRSGLAETMGRTFAEAYRNAYLFRPVFDNILTLADGVAPLFERIFSHLTPTVAAAAEELSGHLANLFSQRTLSDGGEFLTIGERLVDAFGAFIENIDWQVVVRVFETYLDLVIQLLPKTGELLNQFLRTVDALLPWLAILGQFKNAILIPILRLVEGAPGLFVTMAVAIALAGKASKIAAGKGALGGLLKVLGGKAGLAGAAKTAGAALGAKKPLMLGLAALGPKGWAVGGAVAGVGLLVNRFTDFDKMAIGRQADIDLLAIAFNTLGQELGYVAEGYDVAARRAEVLAARDYMAQTQLGNTTSTVAEAREAYQNLAQQFYDSVGASYMAEGAVRQIADRMKEFRYATMDAGFTSEYFNATASHALETFGTSAGAVLEGMNERFGTLIENLYESGYTSEEIHGKMQEATERWGHAALYYLTGMKNSYGEWSARAQEYMAQAEEAQDALIGSMEDNLAPRHRYVFDQITEEYVGAMETTAEWSSRVRGYLSDVVTELDGNFSSANLAASGVSQEEFRRMTEVVRESMGKQGISLTDFANYFGGAWHAEVHGQMGITRRDWENLQQRHAEVNRDMMQDLHDYTDHLSRQGYEQSVITSRREARLRELYQYHGLILGNMADDAGSAMDSANAHMDTYPKSMERVMAEVQAAVAAGGNGLVSETERVHRETLGTLRPRDWSDTGTRNVEAYARAIGGGAGIAGREANLVSNRINDYWATNSPARRGAFSGSGAPSVSGQRLVEGFARGISNGQNSAVNAAARAMQAVRNQLPSSPAKEGPFSGRGWVLYGGESTIEAFGEGMLRGLPKAVSAAEKVAKAVSDVFSDLYIDPYLSLPGAADYSVASSSPLAPPPAPVYSGRDPLYGREQVTAQSGPNGFSRSELDYLIAGFARVMAPTVGAVSAVNEYALNGRIRGRASLSSGESWIAGR